MALCESAYKLERSKRIIALAAVFTKLPAMLFCSDPADCFQEIPFQSAVRVNIEDRLPFRQIRFRKAKELLRKC